MLPKLELDLPWNSRQAPWWDWGRGGRRTGEQGRETRGRRQHSRTSAHVDDHGWKWRHTDETWATCDSVRMSAMHLKTVRGVVRTTQCSRQCALWCWCNCSQCAQGCWSCAWGCPHCSVTFVYRKMFVNIRCKMYSIYKNKSFCLQTVSQVSTFYLKNQVLLANHFHRSRGNGTFYL